ncbi:anti-sigma factor [Thermomicrobium sp.]
MTGRSLADHKVDLEAYALGLLDPAEAVVVAQHLEACVLCQNELRRIEETLGWLGAAVRQVDLPPALRNRILAGADPGDRRRWRLAWAWGGLAAAALLLLGVLLLAVTRLERRLEEFATQQERIVAVLARADWSTVVQGERAGFPPEVGRIFLDREGRDGLLVLGGLERPEAGRVYQVWLLRTDGSRVDAGVFLPDRGGSVLLLIEAPDQWTRYRGMGITIEPGPQGSTEPTGQRIAGCSWDWSAWVRS